MQELSVVAPQADLAVPSSFVRALVAVAPRSVGDRRALAPERLGAGDDRGAAAHERLEAPPTERRYPRRRQRCRARSHTSTLEEKRPVAAAPAHISRRPSDTVVAGAVGASASASLQPAGQDLACPATHFQQASPANQEPIAVARGTTSFRRARATALIELAAIPRTVGAWARGRTRSHRQHCQGPGRWTRRRVRAGRGHRWRYRNRARRLRWHWRQGGWLRGGRYICRLRTGRRGRESGRIQRRRARRSQTWAHAWRGRGLRRWHGRRWHQRGMATRERRWECRGRCNWRQGLVVTPTEATAGKVRYHPVQQVDGRGAVARAEVEVDHAVHLASDKRCRAVATLALG